MSIEVGKEVEFIGYRLADIVYLSEKTAPVDDGDWKGYAESLRVLIARQAREAQTARCSVALTARERLRGLARSAEPILNDPERCPQHSLRKIGRDDGRY